MGKTRDREHKPKHPGFYRKEKLSRASSRRTLPSGRRADVTEPPATGPIKIFLDDEREAPEGFVVARSLVAFRNLLDTVEIQRVHTICLDWHLGANVEPGQSGFDAVDMILERMDDDPAQFGGLSSIWLHSTDIEKAADMARKLAPAFARAEREEILDHVYVVVEKYSPGVGI